MSSAVRWVLVVIAALAVVALIALANGDDQRREQATAATWAVRV
jgi:hypothetical protein